MLDIANFPTAKTVKEIAEKRAKDMHEKALQDIYENNIEPAIKEGKLYTEFSGWNVPDSAIDYLKTLGYAISDKYKESRGILILSWGDIDIDVLYTE